MTNKVILLLVLLVLSNLTYGQKKKIPILQHISSYIITESDTIKIQRYNVTEYAKLNDQYSHQLRDAVVDIQGYLYSRSKGLIADNPNEIEEKFNNLTNLAKVYKVYFNLENYKKEISYYKTEDEKKNKRIKGQDEQIEKEYKEKTKKEEEEKMQRFSDMLLRQKRKDSLFVIEKRQKSIMDSIEYRKQKTINEALEKKRRKQEVKIQVAQKKHEKETKLENEIKKKQRRETIINKYGYENGEAILNHKVKIGWRTICV